jgi:hypothetical protein
MPTTIASCWSEPRPAAASAGAISAMYVGTSTLARPTANPPTTRQAISIHNSPASPLPTALAKNSAAAMRIVNTRP